MSPTAGDTLTLDRDALDAMQARFLERMPDFGDFTLREGSYWQEERAYKLELGEVCRTLLPPALFDKDSLDPDAVVAALGKALTSRLRWAGGPQNIIGWRNVALLKEFAPQDRGVFAHALGQLLYGPGAQVERVDRFTEAVWPILPRPRGGNPYATSRILPTTLLMALDPSQHIAVRTEMFDQAARRLLGRRLLADEPLTGEAYTAVLSFAHSVFGHLQRWAWLPQDLIDVHSFLWVATRPIDAATSGHADSEETE